MERSGWGTADSTGSGLATAVLVGGISTLGLGGAAGVLGTMVLLLETAVGGAALSGSVGELVQPTKIKNTVKAMIAKNFWPITNPLHR